MFKSLEHLHIANMICSTDYVVNALYPLLMETSLIHLKLDNCIFDKDSEVSFFDMLQTKPMLLKSLSICSEY
jgi:hypothetical protein